MPKHFTTVKPIMNVETGYFDGFTVACTCKQEFEPVMKTSTEKHSGYAMHRANAIRDAHQVEHYRLEQGLCPVCGNDTTHISVPESDIVVTQCTVCAYEDAA